MKIHRMIVVAFLLLIGCSPREASDPGNIVTTYSPSSEPDRIDARGLHNVHRFTDRIFSGSSPEGEAGFQSLMDLGIRTILSVDGSRPEIALARRFDLRYVHLPIGYDGISREQALRIARAVRDLPGPVYIHCHHGKHRGPATAALACLSLDPDCKVETALEQMRRAGTDPKYVGLFATVQSYRRPTSQEMEAISPTFSEEAVVAGLTLRMVDIDRCWDHLRLVQSAGWKTPPDHPDIEPAHEALLLREHYHESGRLPEMARRTEEFRRWLTEAEHQSRDLEEYLREGKAAGESGIAGANQRLKRIGEACSRCHAQYRDMPGSR